MNTIVRLDSSLPCACNTVRLLPIPGKARSGKLAGRRQEWDLAKAIYTAQGVKTPKPKARISGRGGDTSRARTQTPSRAVEPSKAKTLFKAKTPSRARKPARTREVAFTVVIQESKVQGLSMRRVEDDSSRKRKTDRRKSLRFGET